MERIAEVVSRDEVIYMGYVEKKDIQIYTNQILHILSFPRKFRFFSFTEFDNIISFTMDEASRKLFEATTIPSSFKLFPEPWSVIQINMGGLGLTETSLVSLCSSLLAHNDISLNYLSTFDHDLILIPQSSFDKAVQILKYNLEENPKEEVINPPSPAQKTTYSLLSLKSELSLVSVTLPPAKVEQNQDEEGMQEAKGMADNYSILAFSMIKHIIFENEKSNLFHFTIDALGEDTQSSMSILATSDTLNACFLQNNSYMKKGDPVRPIRRANKNGLFETGVVSFLSYPLAKNNINILYLSTYKTSFILVPSNQFQDSIDTLKKAQFDLGEDDK